MAGLSRRRLLQAVGGALLLAACSPDADDGDAPGDGETSRRPTREPGEVEGDREADDSLPRRDRRDPPATDG
jgi:hypothetical protein